jgi:hypothetical protein
MAGKRNYEWPDATAWNGYITQDKSSGVTERVSPAMVQAGLVAAGFTVNALPLTGGTLTGALSGTSATFSGSIQISAVDAITSARAGNLTALTVGSTTGFVRSTAGAYAASALVAADIPTLNYLPVNSSLAPVSNFGVSGTTTYSQSVSTANRGVAVTDERSLNWRGGLFSTNAYWGFSQDASLLSSFKPFIIADGTGSIWFKNDPLATIKNTLNGGTTISGTVNLSSVTASSLLKTDGSSNVVAAISGTDYAPATGGSYLPLVGGTMASGALITFADTGTGTTFAGIQGTTGNNDGWRVIGSQSGVNAGYLEIATCDDGTEPIYVRQYADSFSGSPARTLTLLGSSGNTTIPGTLSGTSATFTALNAGGIVKANTSGTLSIASASDLPGGPYLTCQSNHTLQTIGYNNATSYTTNVNTVDGTTVEYWGYSNGASGTLPVILLVNGTPCSVYNDDLQFPVNGANFYIKVCIGSANNGSFLTINGATYYCPDGAGTFAIGTTGTGGQYGTYCVIRRVIVNG